MGIVNWLRTGNWQPVAEAAPVKTAPASATRRAGFEFGIPPGGLTESQQGIGASTQSDRRSLMQQLYESYLACPWSWSAVNAIARNITAGGLVMDWDGDDEEGDKEAPPKPDNVLALERLFKFCNPREDIRQLLRGAITDLEVFGDAFIEVVWWLGIPVALYSLDSPSMRPLADEHGQVTGYAQVTELGQRATFKPSEVIHISLDSPRSGLFGVSPTQAGMLPITAWLFGAATAKEVFRKGNPPTIHIDFPASFDDNAVKRWQDQYMVRNLGPRNIGTPIATKGGGVVNELKVNSIKEYLEFLDQKRDEILAGYGVPPAQVGVIESGNLGGGTGESQRKMFLTNTCDPIAELLLEKLQFALAVQGFGVEGWHVKFAEVDLRDSETVEKIRDMRIRNATWTINRARVEIGEPPTDGGDDAVIIDRQNLVLVKDLAAMSQAGVAKAAKGSALEPDEPADGEPLSMVKPEPQPVPAALAANAGLPGQPPPPGGVPPGAQQPPSPPPGKPAGKAATESVVDQDWRAVSEAWTRQYRARRATALRELAEVGDR